VQLLRAIDRSVVAEPDSFTSLARAPKDLWLESDSGLETALRACLGNVLPVWGRQPYLKLRGVCSMIGTQVAKTFQSGRFVFMLREPRAWAVSHARAFGLRVDTMVKTLLTTLSAYDELLTRGHQPTLIWYEDLCADPLGTLRSLAPLPSGENALRAIRGVMDADAQVDTLVSRAALRDVKISTAELADFHTVWRQRAPHELLERHGLWRLC
jgi:hypothetical protein